MNDNGIYRILVVEDHDVVRWAIRNILEHQGMKIVGEASGVSEAIDIYERYRPDLVLMDLNLADGDGLEATRMLSRCGCPHIIAFTAYNSPGNLAAFTKAGGTAFISKSTPIAKLVPAIKATLSGQKLMDQVTEDNTRQNKPEVPGLSSRESEIAALIIGGLNISQISERLVLSNNTIKTHKRRIFNKLGVHNRAELIEYIAQHGIINTKSLH